MSKAKVLFAWEKGSNLGHISGLVALSRKVTASFAKPVWVLPEAKRRQIPQELILDDIREAPALSPPPNLSRRRPRSYAEVLAWQGFGNRAALHAGLREWRPISLAGDACNSVTASTLRQATALPSDSECGGR